MFGIVVGLPLKQKVQTYEPNEDEGLLTTYPFWFNRMGKVDGGNRIFTACRVFVVAVL